MSEPRALLEMLIDEWLRLSASPVNRSLWNIRSDPRTLLALLDRLREAEARADTGELARPGSIQDLVSEKTAEAYEAGLRDALPDTGGLARPETGRTPERMVAERIWRAGFIYEDDVDRVALLVRGGWRDATPDEWDAARADTGELARGSDHPDGTEHEWADADDDETAWHCRGCGLTEYPVGEKALYNESWGLTPGACNCHHGSARMCPIHTQADYDSRADTGELARLREALERLVTATVRATTFDALRDNEQAVVNEQAAAIDMARAALTAQHTEEEAPEYVMSDTISLDRLADHIADVCGSGGDNWDGAAKGLEFLLFSDGYEIRRRLSCTCGSCAVHGVLGDLTDEAQP